MADGTYDIWVVNSQGERVRQSVTHVIPVEAENTETLRNRASAALTANAQYLAVTSPTTVQVVQQTARLTRQCSALIRLLLGALDSTDGT